VPVKEYNFFDKTTIHDSTIKEAKGDYKYRQCKVCPRCFTIYQIVQRYFDINDTTTDTVSRQLFNKPCLKLLLPAPFGSKMARMVGEKVA
jgi:hypothetical protein